MPQSRLAAGSSRRRRDLPRDVPFREMPGSLRFRLQALFLLGIVIAGVVSAAIAVQLFQGYTRDASYEELAREARGIATVSYTHLTLPTNSRV